MIIRRNFTVEVCPSRSKYRVESHRFIAIVADEEGLHRIANLERTRTDPERFVFRIIARFGRAHKWFADDIGQR